MKVNPCILSRSVTLAIGVYSVFGSNHPTSNWSPHPDSPLDFGHQDAGPLLTILSGWMDVPPKIYEAAGDYEVFSHFSAISIHHKLQIQGIHHLTKIKDLVICNQRDCFST